MTPAKSARPACLPMRLQWKRLHPGWIHLIEYACARHEQVMIALGDHGGVRTRNNPLSVEERIMMVRQTLPHLPDLIIKPIKDDPISNVRWSRRLDNLLEQTFGENRWPVLYGSRDSFIPEYKGIYTTVEVEPLEEHRGTHLREALEFPHTEDARAAIIWDQQHRRSYVYSTTDVAIRDPKSGKVLCIGKNHHGGLLSFVGGHTEKSDGNGKVGALREQGEEVEGIETTDPVLIGNEIIEDPRYRGTEDGVSTSFFVADYIEGEPKANDDADYTEWVDPAEFEKVLVPWHRKLGRLYNEHFAKAPLAAAAA